MSEAYTHLLVPSQVDYRPSIATIARFLETLVKAGKLQSKGPIRLLEILKETGRRLEGKNPFTGQMMVVHLPSRHSADQLEVATLAELARIEPLEHEYNVVLDCTDSAGRLPFKLGSFDRGEWKPAAVECALEVRCCVRNTVVLLDHMDSIDESDRPIDFNQPEVPLPRFDEDWQGGSRTGLFEHPDLGVLAIPNAGSATFRIEFQLGKWLYPKPENGQMGLIQPEVSRLAESVFGVPILQACHWG